MASGRVSKVKGKVVDLPPSPTIGTATAGAESASVTFTADSSGKGGPAFSYRAVSNPGSVIGTSSSSPITVSGLTAGTPYTFTVAAVNPTGLSPYSSASGQVTPTVPPAYESISTINVGGNASFIQFDGIPSTYKHLQIRLIARVTAGGQYCLVTINGDGTSCNYSAHYMESDGSSTYVYGGANSRPAFCQVSSVANNYQPSIIDILDYTSANKVKVFKGFFAQDYNNTSGTATFMSGAWYNSTNAIDTIRIQPNYNAMFAAGSTFALYGIK